ncbi:MAG: hypothetical protein AABW45_02660 [Nanoarchaeota archaeon]
MEDRVMIISKIKRAKNRLKILKSIPYDKPFLPSELVKIIYGKSSGTYFTIISRALGELNKLKLVKVLNDKEKIGRLYKITKKGKEIIKTLN